MNFIDLVFPKKCLECGREGKYICKSCLAKVREGGISSNNIYIFRYEGVIRKAIIALKYKFSIEVTRELAEVCVGKLQENDYSLNTTLVPIPLHWYRQNFRGFNQSAEVGKLIAEQMNWDFEPNLLIKRKSTKSQAELRGSARRKNLREVFSLNPKIAFPDSDIVIFDDVYTTGSTLNEAFEVLNTAHNQKVWGLTIAR